MADLPFVGGLTSLERQVLEALKTSVGQVISRDAIARHAGMREARSNVLEVVVSRLRKKLRDAGVEAQIQSERSRGYVLVVQGGDA